MTYLASEPIDILIFSDRADFHVEFVVKRFPADVKLAVLNIDHYGEEFWFDWDDQRGARCVLKGGGKALSLQHVRSVWWRRPFGLQRQRVWPSSGAGTNPTLGFVYGVVASLAHESFMMNDLRRQAEADRKIRQLSVAREVGFTVPRTFVGTLGSFRNELFSNACRIVVKCHGDQGYTHGTRFLSDVQFEELDNYSGPLIFQEFVAASAEYRVAYVAGQVFCGAFDVSALDHVADIRDFDSLRPTSISLPTNIEQIIVRYCETLGLSFAVFDIRERAGEFYFLEANTCGQWLYIDECNDWAITNAVANALLTGRAAPPHVGGSRGL